MAPIVVPFTRTLTPNRGSPFESYTTPFTTDDCKTSFTIADLSAFALPGRAAEVRHNVMHRAQPFMYV